MIFNLIRNELFKIFKQKGYIIITIILLLGFALSPIVTYLTTNITTTDMYNINTDYKEMLNSYNKYKDDLSFAVSLENIKYFMDKQPDWKYYIYNQERFQLLYSIRQYENIQAGKINGIGSIYYGLSDDEALNMYNSLKNQLTDLDNKITEDTPYIYYQALYESASFRLDLYKQSYEDAKKEYENNPSEKAKLFYDKSCLEYDIAKELVFTITTLLDGNYEPLYWRTNLANIVFNRIAYIDFNYPIMSREEYQSETSDISIPYEEYINECMLVVNGYKEEAYRYIYCVQNNIVPTEYEFTGNNSLKTIVRNSYVTMEGVLWIVFAVMGASIIASEFSHGTGRFLFIRPQKRSLILRSKILTALITYGVITIIGIILQTLVTIIFFGPGDIFNPYVEYIFDTPISFIFVLHFLKLYIEKFVLMFFYMLVAMFFALLTKRTIISIVIVYGVKSVAGLINTVLTIVKKLVKIPLWINYSPLAFTDAIGSNGNIIDELFATIGLSNTISYGYFYNWLGVLYYVIGCALLVLFIHKIYKKVQL